MERRRLIKITEIADILGLRPQTIRNQLSRGSSPHPDEKGWWGIAMGRERCSRIFRRPCPRSNLDAGHNPKGGDQERL